jgi:D-alanyl-D-alanine-carboxypeptidase/D-alanyl-D-alanine-endopeptidase
MIARARRTLLWSAAALSTALPALPAAAQHFPSNDSLTALIRSRVEKGGVGMVLGVLEADGTTRIVSYGSAGLDAKPLGSKSVFEIGSITKVFTGILLADAVDRGLVSLNDPVAKHLPPGTKVPSRNGREITLLDLATHRSSLTRMPTNMVQDLANPYPKYTIPQLYAFLGEHQLRRDIGSEYEYSNIAVALLGHVLERVTGKSYEELVQERILRPLGMTTTSTKVEGSIREWMTVGHDERSFPAAYRGWHELPAMGALRSNAEDLLRFLAANVGPPDTPLERVMRIAHEPRNAVNANADIGLNWQIMKFGSKKIIGHGGATQGFRAFVGFDPDARVGAVVLANYPAPTADFVLHLINPSIPLSGAPVAERIEVEVPESVLRRYVGEYELRPAFTINVTLENGRLVAQSTGQQKAAIFPESETKFFSRSANVQLTFTRDTSGAVTGLVLHQGGRDQPARRRVAPGLSLASAEEVAAALPGRKVSIPSRHLGGDRALRILTPRGYELSQSMRYPVLYVLDTERPLHHAASAVGSMAQSRNAPEMIVVHVSGMPSAAERGAFVKFLTDELQPWVAREYRTAPFSVLVGSADVVAAARAFPASVAIAADHSARASFRGQRQPAAPPESEPHAALGASLKWLFDGWALPNITELASQPGGAGLATIDAHFAKLSERFGFKAVPHEDILDEAGLALARQRRFDDAIRLLEKNRELHPGSARTWNHLGDGYRILCRWPESKEHYTKAHELARAMSYSNVANYAMELSRITQEIESGKSCTPPGAPRPSVQVPESILKTYVGEYAISARLSIVVTLEGGTLYAQPTGQNKAAIRAQSETRFFVEGTGIDLTFTKDDSGAVAGIIVHQGGRDTPGRKVR